MILQILYIIAIVTESITGALAAGRYKMDLFGVLLISLVTAIGGGTIRDILLNMHPMTWVQHPEYVLMLCFFSMLTTRIPYFFANLSKLFLLLDAIGLIAFSVIGVNKAIEYEFGFVVCVIAGVVTGVSGGIARDILCNKIPLVFQKELYASVSIVACILYYCLYFYTPLPSDLAVIITLIVGFMFRVIAIRYELSLPIFSFEEVKTEIKSTSMQQEKHSLKPYDDQTQLNANITTQNKEQDTTQAKKDTYIQNQTKDEK